MSKQWAKAAAVRSVKTFAQAILGGIAVGMAISEVDWLHLFSVAVVAAVISILTSLAGLPEVDGSEKFTAESFEELSDGREEDE